MRHHRFVIAACLTMLLPALTFAALINMPPRLFVTQTAPGEQYDGFTPTIYAAPSDVGSGSGVDEANAMALIDVMEVVEAGDVVGVLPARSTSSYFFTTAATNEVYFDPAASGTSGSPIVIVAKYPAADYPDDEELWSEFRATAPVFSDDIDDLNANRPAFGTFGSTENVHWIGMYFDMQYTSTRPSHGIFYVGVNTEGWKMQKFRVEVYDYYGGNLGGDNPVAVFGAGSAGFEISGNVFIGGGHTPANETEMASHNIAVVMLYGCHDFHINGNTFIGSNTSIFVKGTVNTGEVLFNYGEFKFNKFQDVMLSAIEVADLDAVNPTLIEQNLFIRIGLVPSGIGGETFAIALDRSSQNARNLTINQNTIVDAGVLSGAHGTAIGVKQDPGNYANLTVTNNVIYFGSGLARRGFIFGWFGGTIAMEDTVSNHNLWYGVSGSGGATLFEQDGESYSSLSAWTSDTDQDADSSQIHPDFADADNDDYRRLGTDTGGSEGQRRGAYKTNNEVIGAPNP